MTCTRKLYNSVMVFFCSGRNVYYYNNIIIYIIFLFLFLFIICISYSISYSICLKGRLKGGFNTFLTVSKIVQISIFRRGLDEVFHLKYDFLSCFYHGVMGKKWVNFGLDFELILIDKR